MSQLIGPYNLMGTDAQNAILAPMALNMAAVLAFDDGSDWRVLATNVRVLPRDEMPWAIKPGVNPKYPKGVRARGFWDAHRFPGDILLADDVFAKPSGSPELARKTFAHEGTHQLDEQWLLRSNHKSIKPMFDPDAAGWPSESFAVHGSAAIFGFNNPPYQKFYPDYTIDPANYPDVKAAALRDDRPVVIPPEPEPEPEPVPQVIEVPAGTSIVVKAI